MPAPTVTSRTTQLALLVTLAAAAPLAPAFAQLPVDTLTASDSARLLPVTVTALRTTLPLSQSPFAVAVLGPRELGEGRSGLSLEEALRGVPGLQVDNRFNYALGERISIRGSGARAQFGVRGIRVLVDGIPATLPDGQTTLNHLDPLMLSRAQVVRGPVSALYGNASGGAILLETDLISSAGLGARLSAGAGGNGLVRSRATVGGTAGTLSYGVSFGGLDYDGHREHGSADNRYLDARAGWEGARDMVRVSLNAVRFDALNPGSLSDSLWRVNPRMAFSGNVNNRTGERGEQAQLGASWRHHFANVDVEAAGWGIRRELDNPIPARVIGLDRVAGGARALLRGAQRGLHWTAGVELERQADDRTNHRNVSGESRELLLDQHERVSGRGIFAQLAAPVGGRTTLLGGLRHDRVRFGVEDRFVTATDPDDSGVRVMHALSPSAGVTVELHERLSLYANAASSFETPTTTELANRADGAGGFNPELEPQRLVSFEVGSRMLPAKAASLQLGAYASVIRDALVPFEVPGVAGRQFFRNAGKATVRGVESALGVRATDWMQVELAYTLTDARFRDFTVGGRSYAGNRMPGVAPHRVDLTLTARNAQGAFGAVDIRSMTRTPANDANDAHAPAYAVTDLRAGLGERSVGRLHASLHGGVQNLFDTRYSSSLSVNAFGRRYFEPAPMRTFYVGGELRL